MKHLHVITLSLILLLVGLSLCLISPMLAFAPFSTAIQIESGIIADPIIGLMTGGMVFVAGGGVSVVAGIVWFAYVYRPDRQQQDINYQMVQSLRRQALKLYCDYVMNLIAQHPDEKIQQSLRKHTVGLAATLDPCLKRELVQFLYDLNLISQSPVLSLSGVDLSHIDLQGVNLPTINLLGAIIDNADLRGANLNEAHLSRQQLATVKSYAGAQLPQQMEE